MNNDPNLNTSPPDPQPTNEAPAVKRCPICGKDVPAQATFCGECSYNFNTGNSPYTVPPQAAFQAEDTAPLKTSDYLVMLLVACVPLVNIILLLIWAFSSSTNVNRKNFCRAYLLLTLIMIGVYLIFIVGAVIFAVGMAGVMSDAMVYGSILPFIFR